MEPAVRTSADNPMLNSPTNALGWNIVNIASIPTAEYLAVYASSAPAYARSVRRVDHTDPGFDQDRFYNKLNIAWAGYSCNSQFCQNCVNATGNCGGNNANGKIGWELYNNAGNTGSNSSFDWQVTDGGGNIVTAGIKDGVAGTSIITVGSGAPPTSNSSFSLACWVSHGHLPGSYTCSITNFTGGGNTYPSLNITGICLGNPPLNCIPNDPNYNAQCCVPSWNCSGPPNYMCSDPGDGSGVHSSLADCQTHCIPPPPPPPPADPPSDVHCIINNCDQH